MSRQDDKFVEAVVQELDESSTMLDAETQSRLLEMRRSALAQVPARSHKSRRPLVLALAGSCCAAILSVFIYFGSVSNSDLEAIDDMELLFAGEDLEMLQDQDLEFYLWLETQESEVSVEDS
jgi:hypothetical protein